jgi:hypothetical protein
MKKKSTFKYAPPEAGQRILGWIISRDLRDAALEDIEGASLSPLPGLIIRERIGLTFHFPLLILALYP